MKVIGILINVICVVCNCYLIAQVLPFNNKYINSVRKKSHKIQIYMITNGLFISNLVCLSNNLLNLIISVFKGKII